MLCANNKPYTPRYSPLGKPAHPTDRPTGTIKQLFVFWSLFSILFFLHLAPFEPQQSSRSNQQNNNKNEPLFLYCSMPLLSYTSIITTLPSSLCTIVSSVLLCLVACLAINISVQHYGGLLPDIILFTQDNVSREQCSFLGE